MATRVFLGLMGSMWAAYGLWCFADPAVLREAAGIAAVNATGSVDLRATYGGLQTAVGVLLLAGAWRSRLAPQVLLGYAVICAGLGVARLAGAVLESEWSGYTAFAIGFELGSVLLALLLLGRGGADVRVG